MDTGAGECALGWLKKYRKKRTGYLCEPKTLISLQRDFKSSAGRDEHEAVRIEER